MKKLILFFRLLAKIFQPCHISEWVKNTFIHDEIMCIEMLAFECEFINNNHYVNLESNYDLRLAKEAEIIVLRKEEAILNKFKSKDTYRGYDIEFYYRLLHKFVEVYFKNRYAKQKNNLDKKNSCSLEIIRPYLKPSNNLVIENIKSLLKYHDFFISNFIGLYIQLNRIVRSISIILCYYLYGISVSFFLHAFVNNSQIDTDSMFFSFLVYGIAVLLALVAFNNGIFSFIKKYLKLFNIHPKKNILLFFCSIAMFFGIFFYDLINGFFIDLERLFYIALLLVGSDLIMFLTRNGIWEMWRIRRENL